MKKHAIFLALTGCLVSFNLAAQSHKTNQADSSRVIALQEVQVRANRASRNTPMSFNELKKEDLRKEAYGQDLPYLLGLTPGLVFTSDAGTGIGYTSLSIRGADAGRINIMTNGVPLNDSESQAVFWVNMPDFSSSLQNIQVQRGVGTSANGAAAFGASINMRTENLGLTPYGQVDLSGGSYGTFRRSVKFGSGRIGGHWAFDGRLSRITTDGYIHRSDVALDSYFAQAAYFAENTVLKFITFGGREKTGVAWNGIDPDDIPKLGRRYNSAGYMYTDTDGKRHFFHNYDNYVQRHYQAILTYTFNPQWSLNLTTHLTRGIGYTEEYRTGRKLLEYNLQPFEREGKKIKKTDLLRDKYLDNWFAGGIASLNYHNNQWDITAGGAANHYNGKHFGYIKWIKDIPAPVFPDFRYYDNNARKTDASGYVKVNYSPIPALTIFVDLQARAIRYRLEGSGDKYDERLKKMQYLDMTKSFSFFNPKAGFSYSLSTEHNLYASIAVSNREPNRKAYTEAGINQQPTSERLTDYELGYRFSGNNIQASANVYWMQYKNQLVFDGRRSDVGEMLTSNVPKSYRTGLELSLGWQPVNYFRWDFAGAFSRSRIDNYRQTAEVYGENDYYDIHSEVLKNKSISFSPDVVVTNVFTGMYHGISLSLTSRYVSKQYLDNTQSADRSMPGYFTSDIRLNYSLPVSLFKRCIIGLVVNNLFNADYYSNAGAGFAYKKQADGSLKETGWKWIYPQAPVNFIGTLSILF